MHSLNNKLSEVMEHLLDCDSDIAFLTETWLKSNKCNLTAAIRDFGYYILHSPRNNSSKTRGGGVGILLEFYC